MAAHVHWQDCYLCLAMQPSQKQKLTLNKAQLQNASHRLLPRADPLGCSMTSCQNWPGNTLSLCSSEHKHCYWKECYWDIWWTFGSPHELPHLICYVGFSLFVAKPPMRQLAIFCVTWDWTPTLNLLGCCYHLFFSPSFSPCFWSTYGFPPGTPCLFPPLSCLCYLLLNNENLQPPPLPFCSPPIPHFVGI